MRTSRGFRTLLFVTVLCMIMSLIGGVHASPPDFSEEWGEAEDTTQTDTNMSYIDEKTPSTIVFAGQEIPIDVKELDLSDKDIADITPIQALVNLTVLDLSYNDLLIDLSPLSSLENLTELNLFGDERVDIATLPYLSRLESLDLGLDDRWNKESRNIMPLKAWKNLKRLSLRNNYTYPDDIVPLRGLTNLTELDISGMSIDDIRPLQSLENLEKLALDVSSNTDLLVLQSLTTLTELNLTGKYIDNLSPLQTLTTLTELSLTGDNIYNLSPLQSLTNLEKLDLNCGKRLTVLTPLQSLTNLTELCLRGEQVKDITPLRSLTIYIMIG